jgi:hypothetical protein
MTLKKVSAVYYHGTSVSNIENFEFGILGKGECIKPVSGIWLASNRSGAEWHAISKIKNISVGYVYKVNLDPEIVLADTAQSALPDAAYETYKRQLGFFKRLVSKNKNWYSVIYKKACKLKGVDAADEILREEIIKVCKSIGIDGILNPVATVVGDNYEDHNSGKYGTTLLLINPAKVSFLSRVGEVKPI